MTSLTVLGWQIRQGCQPRLPRQQDTSVSALQMQHAGMADNRARKNISSMHQIHNYVSVPCMGPKVLQATLPAAG
jgi:hypothetical protein